MHVCESDCPAFPNSLILSLGDAFWLGFSVDCFFHVGFCVVPLNALTKISLYVSDFLLQLTYYFVHFGGFVYSSLAHSCVLETSIQSFILFKNETLNSFSDISAISGLWVSIKKRFGICPGGLLSHNLCVSLWCFMHQLRWIYPPVLTHLFPTLFCFA